MKPFETRDEIEQFALRADGRFCVRFSASGAHDGGFASHVMQHRGRVIIHCGYPDPDLKEN